MTQIWCRKLPDGRELEHRFGHPTPGTLSVSPAVNECLYESEKAKERRGMGSMAHMPGSRYNRPLTPNATMASSATTLWETFTLFIYYVTKRNMFSTSNHHYCSKV